MVPHALLSVAFCAVSAAAAGDEQSPTVVLANGVVMPRVLLGMGPWCTHTYRYTPYSPGFSLAVILLL
jgi:hypothetical protein|eukprot:COSAG02_NODE_4322_length_5501_cov_5.325990_7_plen_68_part_00